MDWMYLFLAGLLEIGWAVGMKYTNGFSRLLPSLWTLFSMVASFLFLSLAIRSIPLGTAYAVWTGIGAVGVVIAGILLFQEPYDLARLICMAFILMGIVGLKLFAPH